MLAAHSEEHGLGSAVAHRPRRAGDGRLYRPTAYDGVSSSGCGSSREILESLNDGLAGPHRDGSASCAGTVRSRNCTHPARIAVGRRASRAVRDPHSSRLLRRDEPPGAAYYNSARVAAPPPRRLLVNIGMTPLRDLRLRRRIDRHHRRLFRPACSSEEHLHISEKLASIGLLSAASRTNQHALTGDLAASRSWCSKVSSPMHPIDRTWLEKDRASDFPGRQIVTVSEPRHTGAGSTAARATSTR